MTDLARSLRRVASFLVLLLLSILLFGVIILGPDANWTFVAAVQAGTVGLWWITWRLAIVIPVGMVLVQSAVWALGGEWFW